jgi:predicted nucleic acid-binding protein
MVGPRILSFDESAVIEAARIAADAEASGTPIGQADSQIAAIARTHGFTIATRDGKPCAQAGLDVINPWDSKLE